MIAKLIDAHNDTASRLFWEKESLLENSFHVDLKKQTFFSSLLVYAFFMDPEKTVGFSSPLSYFDVLYDNFVKELQKNENIIKITMHAENLLRSDKQLAMLSVEGGSLIESVETLDYLWEKQIKILTLTWNDSNRLATSAVSNDAGGLTKFGHQILTRMNEIGMLADLSHASDQTFWDVLEHTKKPVLVSHSNARALCSHPRNITDNMFRALMENGGVLGINFYPPFLGENATMKTIFSHIEHFLNLGGENHIGFGADFDGVDCLPKGITDFSSFSDIINEMERRNYPTDFIEKICYKNMMRILK